MNLRYVELQPSRIYNWLAPENCTAWLNVPQWRDDWWTPEIVELRKEFARVWIEEYDALTGHFTNLRNSIIRDGINNPLPLIGGPPRDQYLTYEHPEVRHVPPEWRNNLSHLIYTHPSGGSRLSIAAELNIPVVKCVVHDFTNLFPNAPIVNSWNVSDYFTKDFTYTQQLPHIRVKSMSHMANPNTGMTPGVRKQQALATQLTKEKMHV